MNFRWVRWIIVMTHKTISRDKWNDCQRYAVFTRPLCHFCGGKKRRLCDGKWFFVFVCVWSRFMHAKGWFPVVQHFSRFFSWWNWNWIGHTSVYSVLDWCVSSLRWHTCLFTQANVTHIYATLSSTTKALTAAIITHTAMKYADQNAYNYFALEFPLHITIDNSAIVNVTQTAITINGLIKYMTKSSSHTHYGLVRFYTENINSKMCCAV